MLVAKLKIWIIIQLVKTLEVSPRHPNRYPALDPSDIDDALCTLRENKVGIIGYGLS